MRFDDLLKSGQLKKENTSKAKIAEFLRFAEEEAAAAKFNFPKFRLTAYKSAYDALIHAGNALIRYYGYRPTAKYTHVTITEFLDRVLSKEYGDLVRSFKHMRRKRHPLQYEARFLESDEEIKGAIHKAEDLIKKIEEFIKIKPEQNRLF
jgi:uncharacterized protein (UPF0332 family)